MKLKKPTIFESSDEVQEAVDCGYLDIGYGYLHEGVVHETCNNSDFPTVFWDDGGRNLTHQPNGNGAWSRYMDVITEAKTWKYMKLNYPAMLEVPSIEEQL